MTRAARVAAHGEIAMFVHVVGISAGQANASPDNGPSAIGCVHRSAANAIAA